MRIESIKVKLLRSVESYTNDETEIRVALDDGDDWKRIEQELRLNAEALIELHWQKKREAEEAEQLKRAEARAAHEAGIIAQRDKYFEDVEAEKRDCSKCPAFAERLCGPCPNDIPF